MRVLGLVCLACAVICTISLVFGAVADTKLPPERRHPRLWYGTVIAVIVLGLVLFALNQ